jgi:hypothetical protein
LLQHFAFKKRKLSALLSLVLVFFLSHQTSQQILGSFIYLFIVGFGYLVGFGYQGLGLNLVT